MASTNPFDLNLEGAEHLSEEERLLLVRFLATKHLTEKQAADVLAIQRRHHSPLLTIMLALRYITQREYGEQILDRDQPEIRRRRRPLRRRRRLRQPGRRHGEEVQRHEQQPQRPRHRRDRQRRCTAALRLTSVGVTMAPRPPYSAWAASNRFWPTSDSDSWRPRGTSTRASTRV